MIYCPQCGNPNFDDANFCDTCGEPLVSADVYAQIKEKAEMDAAIERERQEKQMHAYAKAYDKAKKEAAAAAGSGAMPASAAPGAVPADDVPPADAAPAPGAEVVPPAGAVPPPDAPAPGASEPAPGAPTPGAPGAAAPGAPAPASTPGIPAPAPAPQVTVYKHGCVAQAWDDITESPGWGKKMTLLGLINIIPILNFFTFGYAMNWAAQLESDRVEPMPNKILGDGFFLQGFYAFVIIIVFSIIGGLVSTVLNIIPILGAIVGIAVSIGIQIFYMLSLMRVAISRELGPGFAFADIWAAVGGNQFGKLFCATIVPGLIVGAAILFICGSIIVLFGLASFASIMNIIQMMDAGYPDYMYSQALASLILTIIPIIFVCYAVTQFVQVFAIVLQLRATSHFIMRYLPSWRALAKPQQVYTQPTYYQQ